MSGQCCNNVHLSMDDTFIQWNEILGDPSSSTVLVEFVNQKIAGAGGDIGALIDEKIAEAISGLKEELIQEIEKVELEIDPYKITYKDTTVGDALDELRKEQFECKIFDLGEFEVGQNFTTFTVGWEMSEDPQSQTILRVRNNAPTERYKLDPSARSYTFANVSGDEKYIVKGVAPNGEEFGTSAEVKFKKRLYYGTFDSTNPTNRVITNWSSQLIDASTDIGRRIFDCENGEYIYFAIPEGLHRTYDFFSNGLKDNNWVYEITNVTNQFGTVIPYRIYRTGNMLHGYNIYIEVESHDWY